MPQTLVEFDSSRFPVLRALFCGLDHSVAIVHSVLEGNSPGRVFVDDPISPRLALLYTEGAYCYLVGDHASPATETVPDVLFGQLVPTIEDGELVVFGLDDLMRARLDELLGPRGAIRIQRCIYQFRPERFAGLSAAPVPAGFRLSPIDSCLAARHTELAPLTDPATRRFGVALLRAGELISVCSAVFVGGGYAESDVSTVEPQRGRGFATLVARAFIEETMARGLTPAWSCWPEREASRALARRLGFEELPPVPAQLWDPSMGR